MKPKVTVIVVNYNSRTKWNIVSQSLRSILELKYRPLEIILIDNGSTDGSYELIKDMLKVVKQDEEFKFKLVRLSRNYGFAVANIIAYLLRDPESKYVALINNDLAPRPESLDILVQVLEKYPRVAGVQGVILTWDEMYIDSYGCIVTQHGISYAIGSGLGQQYVAKLKPTLATYVDGAYSVYRVEALESVGGLFLPYFFMYGDDYELGIRLWRNKWILLSVPIIAGRHYRSASTTISLRRSLLEPPKMSYIYEYWSWLSNIAVLVVLYGNPWILRLLERIPTTLIAAILKRSKAIIRGFVDGILIGLKLRKSKKLNRIDYIVEPRIYVNPFKELALLTKLFIHYGNKASRIYSLVITRALGRKILLKEKA